MPHGNDASKVKNLPLKSYQRMLCRTKEMTQKTKTKFQANTKKLLFTIKQYHNNG